jgi:poly(A) polymerase
MRGGAAHRSIYLAWDLGVLAELMPEVTTYLDDDAPGADLTWGRLGAADRCAIAGELPDDAVLLGALLLGPIEEAVEGARDPADAFDDFIEPLALRVALPRRLKDRVRGLVLAQPRLRAGRIGNLARRDIFADALALFRLDTEARDEALPEWAIHPEIAPPEDSPTRRRRRRRRRPRRM